MSTDSLPPSPAWFRSKIAVNLLGLLAALGAAFVLSGLLTASGEQMAVAVVGLAGVLLAIALWPRFGLLFWLVLAPFASLFQLHLGRGVPDIGLNRSASLFLLLLIFAQVATGRRRLSRFTAFDAAAGLYVIALLLSVPASRLGVVNGVQTVFDFVIIPLLVYFFGRELLHGPAGLRWSMVALAIIAVMLGLITVQEQLTNQPILSPIQYRLAYGQYSIKVTSLFGSPAAMSLALSMALPLLLVAAARPGRLAGRLPWMGALLAALAGIVLAYVRAGWLAALTTLLLLIALDPSSRRFGRRLLLVLGVAVAIVAISQIDSRAFQERLQSEGPIEYRRQALEIGLDAAARSPLFGLGLDNFVLAAIQRGWMPRGEGGVLAIAPHNMYLYLLTSAGLVGLLPFLAMHGLIAWRALRGRRAAGLAPPADRGPWAALLAVLVAYALFGATFDNLTAQYANMLFFLVVGVVSAPPLPAVEEGGE